MERNKLIILLFFFSTLFSFAYSQTKSWNKSFIVLKNIDTIHGYIKANSASIFSRILFKKNILEKSLMYEPKDIISFQLKNDTYESIFLNKEITGIAHYIFAKKIIDGKIILYNSRYRYFSCACEPEGAINDGYIAIKNDSIFIINKKLLSNKIKDSSILLELINDSKFFIEIKPEFIEYQDIPKLIDSYNSDLTK